MGTLSPSPSLGSLTPDLMLMYEYKKAAPFIVNRAALVFL